MGNLFRRVAGPSSIGVLAALALAQVPTGCAETDEPWYPDSVVDYGSDDGGGGADDAAVRDDAATADDGARDDGARDDGTTDTGTCPESPCRILPDCGCPGGEKCSLNFTELADGNVVRECHEAGSNTSSQLCEADTDCRSETVCSQLLTDYPETTTTAMCYDFCMDGGDCDPTNGSLCIPLASAAGAPGTCSHACNLITNSGCPSGSACKPLTLTASGDQLTDCGGDVGSGAHGAPCIDDADCRAGTVCMETDGDSVPDTCLRLCDNVDGACSGGLGTCYGWTTPFVINGVEYGVCFSG